MRKFLSKVDWAIVSLIGFILFLCWFLAVAFGDYNAQRTAYDKQCIKSGGTPVFNGEFRECFGVKSKGEH